MGLSRIKVTRPLALAKGELTPRALTSSYTILRVRLPKPLNILASLGARNGLPAPLSLLEGSDEG
jgi:hypothetical protein